MVSIEGTRSYGIGLARAVTAAGLVVIECEQPHRKARRGRGKSDPIDAHLAVLTALRLDADRLPTPRADGDREALRILLGARHDLTTTSTAQTNRLRALLLAGDDPTADLARAALTDTTLAALARRRQPPRRRPRPGHPPRRDPPPRPWPCARPPALNANRAHLQTIVDDLAPGLTDRRGIGPVTAAQALVVASPTPAAAATRPRSPPSPAPARCRPAAAAPCGTGSTAAATAPSTAPSTPSS